MSNRTAISGLFVAKNAAGVTQVELLNPELPSPPHVSILRLKLSRDFDEIMREARIPRVFGTDVFCQCKAMVHGHLDIATSDSPTGVLDSITCLELLHEYRSGTVSYILRFDGGSYIQCGNVESLPSNAIDENQLLIRLRCLIQHRLRRAPEINESILLPIEGSTWPGRWKRIILDTSGLVELSGHLSFASSQEDNVLANPVLTGLCEAEGVVKPCITETDSVSFLPTLLTIECGIAAHRLWRTGCQFRWFAHDNLVVPIGSFVLWNVASGFKPEHARAGKWT